MGGFDSSEVTGVTGVPATTTIVKRGSELSKCKNQSAHKTPTAQKAHATLPAGSKPPTGEVTSARTLTSTDTANPDKG